MSITNKLKHYILFAFGAFAVCLIAVGLIWRVILPLQDKADEVGNTLGTQIGTLVGRAIGTRNGDEVSYSNGFEDGKQAVDNDVRKAEFIETLGTEKLFVFSADVQEPVYYEFPEDDEEDKTVQYAAMKILSGKAYFYVDAGQAQVSVDGNQVTITLPQPAVELKGGDITDTTPAAEYQRWSWSGNATDGINGYNETIAWAQNNMEAKLEQNELLMQLACNSAETQIKALAYAAFGSGVDVSVAFTE